MSPLALGLLSIVIGIVLFGSRRMALVGFFVGILFLHQGVSATVLGINLFALRLIELAAFIRVIIRGEFRQIRPSAIDRVLVLLFVFTTIVFLIRSREDHAYQIGIAVDALLCYFAFRSLIKSLDDTIWCLRAVAFLLLPYVALVLAESFTGENPFQALGEFAVSGWERDGRIRCIGSFRHPSLLGGMGAAFLPLYIGLAFDRTIRHTAYLGIISCCALVWASNSGGPASSAAAGLAGWAAWPFRHRLREIQYLALGLFIALALVMKAPIWYLLARVSAVAGGTGWHRAHLIEQAVNDLDKWWLAGMPIRETASWFPYVIKGTGGADITNQFLIFGLSAGLGAVILFVTLLIMSLRLIGSARKSSNLVGWTGLPIPMLWGLGVTILVHISNWLGIGYFDQSYAIWYLHLAMVIAAAGTVMESLQSNYLAESRQSLAPLLDSPSRSSVIQPGIKRN